MLSVVANAKKRKAFELIRRMTMGEKFVGYTCTLPPEHYIRK